jgi:hypothetical protein
MRWFFAALLLALAGPASASVVLHYSGPVGQVTTYRLSMKVTGRQVNLGSPRPIKAELEYELQEEVVGSDPDGGLLLQVSGRVVNMKDLTGALTGRPQILPLVNVHVSARGEILDPAATPAATIDGQALSAFLSQPLPVILPAAAVETGAIWKWEKHGAKQSNTLLSRDGPEMAHLRSRGSAPVTAEVVSKALGLTTRITGLQWQTSTLDLLLNPGLILHHKGTITLQTKSEITMEAPAGRRAFLLEMKARIDFNLDLIRLNGKPVRAGRGSGGWIQ